VVREASVVGCFCFFSFFFVFFLRLSSFFQFRRAEEDDRVINHSERDLRVNLSFSFLKKLMLDFCYGGGGGGRGLLLLITGKFPAVIHRR